MMTLIYMKIQFPIIFQFFERLFLLDNQKPYGPHYRSSLRVKQAEKKRHFSDPSLACALMGVTEESLLGDMETLGFLFEALCERDLKIYAEANDAKLFSLPRLS